jgi:hypothetical protein
MMCIIHIPVLIDYGRAPGLRERTHVNGRKRENLTHLTRKPDDAGMIEIGVH